ncbi:MAG: dienelactone hydrolase family protein [Magnetococcales bacterium]|nr:dienelactone hydrolase family protein [Magnetococcales bacterium]
MGWMAKWAAVAALTWAMVVPAQAALQSREIVYQDGETPLAGYLAWDDAFSGPRPGVLVVHEWWGLNDYAKKRAEMLAGLGYVALAADMYGVGHVTTHAKEAKGWMEQVTGNQEMWQRRAVLALDQLKKAPTVDSSRMAAIGYCFGGATVMQLAYAGAEVKGVVSFHGSMPLATAEQTAKIKGKVMIAHGYADAFIPAERVTAFQQALDLGGVDWRMLTLGGAVHGFTNPEAAKAGMEGMRYDEKADQRSWRAMQDFFNEIFAH